MLDYEANEESRASYFQMPQRKRETRRVSTSAVNSLVRCLMATERARLLGRKAITLGQYTLEKRTQRWRESRKCFIPDS